MNWSLELPARAEELPRALAWAGGVFQEVGASPRARRQMEIALEEIFVNIARYAYRSGEGNVTIRASLGGDPKALTLRFCDSGAPFDPLAREDPDVSLDARSREIGGLGIYLVKELMDAAAYQYVDRMNVFTITKIL